MTEEIDVDGLAGQTPQARDGLDGELRVHGCAADRAEAAGIRDRGREFDRAESRHRRQHNRMFDLKQFEETSVGPHSRASYRQPADQPPST
jgi:hypothetical protein